MMHHITVGYTGRGKMEAVRQELKMSQEEFMAFWQKQIDALSKVQKLKEELKIAEREYFIACLSPNRSSEVDR